MLFSKGEVYHLVVVIAQLLHIGKCANLTDVSQLYDSLLDGYNKNLLPQYDAPTSIIVAIQMAGIQKFDEITGELEISTVVFLKWKDPRLAWSPSDFGGTTSLLLQATDLWIPIMYVLKTTEQSDSIGTRSVQPRVFSDGTIVWNSGMSVSISCSVDVTYFPFDSQNCPLIIQATAYNLSEVQFVLGSDTLRTSFYTSNSQWELKESSVNLTSYGITPGVSFDINLKRRSDFFVVYIVLPMICLGFMNNLVLIMPVASGERMSVAVTIFLSFVVYMEIVTDCVPESSSPIAYIFYYIVVLLLNSSLIFIVCLISLQIHDKQKSVPRKVQTFTNYMRFACFRSNSSDTKVYPFQQDDELPAEKIETDIDKPDNKYSEITWTTVGKTFDCYFAVIFITSFTLFTLVTWNNLYYNTDL